MTRIVHSGQSVYVLFIKVNDVQQTVGAGATIEAAYEMAVRAGDKAGFLYTAPIEQWEHKPSFWGWFDSTGKTGMWIQEMAIVQEAE